MFMFEILQLLRETFRVHSVEYSHSQLYGFFVVTEIGLSLISSISSLDSLPNFLPMELGFPQKILCQVTFAALNSI